ncbi:MAG: hypothetical protein ABH829_05420 [archaeon]
MRSNLSDHRVDIFGAKHILFVTLLGLALMAASVSAACSPGPGEFCFQIPDQPTCTGAGCTWTPPNYIYRGTTVNSSTGQAIILVNVTASTPSFFKFAAQMGMDLSAMNCKIDEVSNLTDINGNFSLNVSTLGALNPASSCQFQGGMYPITITARMYDDVGNVTFLTKEVMQPRDRSMMPAQAPDLKLFMSPAANLFIRPMWKTEYFGAADSAAGNCTFEIQVYDNKTKTQLSFEQAINLSIEDGGWKHIVLPANRTYMVTMMTFSSAPGCAPVEGPPGAEFVASPPQSFIYDTSIAASYGATKTIYTEPMLNWTAVQINGTISMPAGEHADVVGLVAHVVQSAAPYGHGLGQGMISPQTDALARDTGAYNFSLPGSATLQYILEASAYNATTNTWYVGYKQIVTSTGPQIADFTLYPALGRASVASNAFNDLNKSIMNFTFHDSGNANRSTDRAGDMKLTVSYPDGTSIDWMLFSDSGSVLQMPIPLYANITYNAFSPSYAPRKGTLNYTDLLGYNSTGNIPIYFKSFDMKPPDGGSFVNTPFMYFFKYEAACNAPVVSSLQDLTAHPCYLNGPFPAIGFFPDMAATVEKVNLIMITPTSPPIMNMYVGVELVETGPPDIEYFESAIDTITTGANIENIWKFGSKAPAIYDYSLVGVPVNMSQLNARAGFTSKIPMLYDDNWNMVWNGSLPANENATNIPSDFSDYPKDFFNASSPMACTASYTPGTTYCYYNESVQMVWWRFEHFTGVAPGYTGSAGDSPNVTLNTPLNLTYTSNPAVLFNFTAWDPDIAPADQENLTCYLWMSTNICDDVYSIAAPPNVTQNNTATSMYRTITSMYDGCYEWYVNCTDGFGNAGWPASRRLYVDTWNATTSVGHSATTWYTSATMNITFTCTDPTAAGTPSGCNATYYRYIGTTGWTAWTALDTSSLTVGADLPYEGNLTYQYYSLDKTQNNESIYLDAAQTTNVLWDKTTPVVTAYSYPSQTNGTDPYANYSHFNVTAVDASDEALSCILYVDDIARASNLTVRNNTATNMTSAGIQLAAGTHTWNVTCSDRAGHSNSTAMRTIAIDGVAPATSVVCNGAACSQTSWYSSDVTLNFTCTDTGVAGCSVVGYAVTGVASWTGVSASGAGYLLSSEGNNTVYYNSTDAFGNVEATNTLNILIDKGAPGVTANAPAHYSNTSSTSFSANFTAVDAVSSAMICSLMLDGTTAQTGITAPNNTAVQATTQTVAEGGHYWNVTCADLTGLTNSTSIRNFTMDATAPSVSAVISPSLTVNNTYVLLNVTVTDTTVTHGQFTLTKPDTTAVTADLSVGSTNRLYNRTYVDQNGTYSVTFNITDAVGLQTITSSYSFAVKQPVQVVINVTNSTGSSGGVIVEFVDPATNQTINSTSSTTSNTTQPATAQLNIKITDTATNVSFLLPVNTNSDVSFAPTAQKENASLAAAPTGVNASIVQMFSPNVSVAATAYLSFNYSQYGYSDTAAASLKAYKCSSYNSTAGVCSGSWTELTRTSLNTGTKIVTFEIGTTFSTFLVGLYTAPATSDTGGEDITRTSPWGPSIQDTGEKEETPLEEAPEAPELVSEEEAPPAPPTVPVKEPEKAPPAVATVEAPPYMIVGVVICVLVLVGVFYYAVGSGAKPKAKSRN